MAAGVPGPRAGGTSLLWDISSVGYVSAGSEGAWPGNHNVLGRKGRMSVLDPGGLSVPILWKSCSIWGILVYNHDSFHF